jgi:hypothetical protein
MFDQTRIQVLVVATKFVAECGPSSITFDEKLQEVRDAYQTMSRLVSNDQEDSAS